MIEGGVHGLMPCGTTGETALLEADEVIAVVETVVEAARGRVPVVAHVGRPSTTATARLIERAIDAGAEGVSAIVPYYYAFGDREIIAHFRALLKAAGDTPLLAYNFPARTGQRPQRRGVRLTRRRRAGAASRTRPARSSARRPTSPRRPTRRSSSARRR